MSKLEAVTTVVIGGREVPVLVAALIAQEAARLNILPREVGDVVIPEPAPIEVEIARGCSVSIVLGALIAADADARGILVIDLIALVIGEHLEALDRRARARTDVPVDGPWMLPSSLNRRGGRGGTYGDA